MELSTAELTVSYIKEHPHIKNCLKRGLINYSSLARLISEELGLGKKSSKEAILIAARRFRERLGEEQMRDEGVASLLGLSELNVRNKILVVILEKQVDPGRLSEIHASLQRRSGLVFLLEGSDSYTLITQERYVEEIRSEFEERIVKMQAGLAMITFRSPEDIEDTPGVLSYLTSLFAENGVNIVEFLSCWRDTVFVISGDDVKRALEFLDF